MYKKNNNVITECSYCDSALDPEEVIYFKDNVDELPLCHTCRVKLNR